MATSWVSWVCACALFATSEALAVVDGGSIANNVTAAVPVATEPLGTVYGGFYVKKQRHVQLTMMNEDPCGNLVRRRMTGVCANTTDIALFHVGSARTLLDVCATGNCRQGVIDRMRHFDFSIRDVDASITIGWITFFIGLAATTTEMMLQTGTLEAQAADATDAKYDLYAKRLGYDDFEDLESKKRTWEEQMQQAKDLYEEMSACFADNRASLNKDTSDWYNDISFERGEYVMARETGMGPNRVKADVTANFTLFGDLKQEAEVDVTGKKGRIIKVYKVDNEEVYDVHFNALCTFSKTNRGEATKKGMRSKELKKWMPGLPPKNLLKDNKDETKADKTTRIKSRFKGILKKITVMRDETKCGKQYQAYLNADIFNPDKRLVLHNDQHPSNDFECALKPDTNGYSRWLSEDVKGSLADYGLKKEELVGLTLVLSFFAIETAYHYILVIIYRQAMPIVVWCRDLSGLPPAEAGPKQQQSWPSSRQTTNQLVYVTCPFRGDQADGLGMVGLSCDGCGWEDDLPEQCSLPCDTDSSVWRHDEYQYGTVNSALAWSRNTFY